MSVVEVPHKEQRHLLFWNNLILGVSLTPLSKG